ncbi:MAG: MBL fold metallo-hydrolase [Rubrivivax sp.]
MALAELEGLAQAALRCRAAGLLLACSLAAGAAGAADAADAKATRAGDGAREAAAKAKVYGSNPQLVQSIRLGGGFGTEISVAIANRMYSRTDAAAIADARAKLKIEPQGARTWLLRFPIVNVVVFETDAGLVLVDSGYAPAGPALAEALARLSTKPVHTIVLTHFHADHAFGAWALMQGALKPQVVTSALFVDEMEEDMRTYGLIARNNQQPLDEVPRSWDQAVRPTKVFHDRKLTLSIGGEDFVLTHAPGETADQLWVWAPARRVVVAADYFQPQLPNAGNGKRRQRYPLEWAQALREMARLKPARVLPMHGPALDDEAQIQERVNAQAKVLETISEQVLAGLNAGLRRDQAVERVALPPELARRPDERPIYNSVRDIANMEVKRASGWWDDIPSHWAPAPVAEQARELAALAGGAQRLIERALALAPNAIALAAQLADLAWFAAPDDDAVVRGAMEVYRRRVAEPLSTQEALVYAEHMVRLQLKLDELAAKR